jgi:uncharacterized protein
VRLAPDLELPLDSVSRTFGILAMRGAGKSNAAAVMAEEMFAAKLPFVVVDPVGSWFGMRSSSDGTGPGLAIPIFGGKHGDLPLDRSNGVALADLIVSRRLSCILDLSTFDSESAKKQFLLDFARHLYQKNEDPLHLFLEEADDYIPQKPMRDEAQLLRAWENIVRRGRSRGLGMTMITQRSASINKMVLTQVETLIVLRTTGPQDIKAIEAWIQYHQAGEEVISSLSALADGDAWVWSPQFLGTMKRIHIRRRRTFDSGATPKNFTGSNARPTTTLADVNLDDIQKQMASTIEKAKANDPSVLQRQILALKQEIVAIKKAPPRMPDVPKSKDDVSWVAENGRLQKRIAHLNGILKKIKSMLAGNFFDDTQVAVQHVGPSDPRIPRLTLPVKFEQRTTRAVSSSSELGNSGLRRIMIALAQYPQGRSARQVGILAGLSSKSGSFNTYLSKGRSSGWIEGERGLLRITDAGLDMLGDFDPLPQGEALLNYWLNELGDSGAARILRVLADRYPKAVSKEEVGRAADLSHTSGSFNTYLSRLRTLELAEGRGDLRASDTLFL